MQNRNYLLTINEILLEIGNTSSSSDNINDSIQYRTHQIIFMPYDSWK